MLNCYSYHDFNFGREQKRSTVIKNKKRNFYEIVEVDADEFCN